MQIVAAKKVNSKREETALPGLNATKLVTVSSAINDENKAMSTFSATFAPAAVKCEYFIQIFFAIFVR